MEGIYLIVKYRVHEVAKDFGLPTKTITEILTKYASAPKNHMQVLTDHELSVIFDYLTQHNQVSGIQVIFSDTFKEEKKAEAPKAAAPVVHKLLSSAIANAVNNNEMDRKALYVAEIYANPGPTLKRYVARSRGSASPVLKRTSHISVVLDQK